MKISEKALNFAIKAHEGQFRKEETDRPYILHPMIVGDILKYYGFDDNVVAAGYLHDVVENTDFTVDDISVLFGGDISSLVLTATYPPEYDDWKERRKNKIKISKDLPIRNKAVILADQIANIEERKIVADKKGYLDASKFNADIENHIWYHENMLESLGHDAVDTELLPLLNRLYINIRSLFYQEKIDYNHDMFFTKYDYNQYETKKLQAEKKELIDLKNLLNSPKPFIIEFASTKEKINNSFVDICLDFFKDSGYKIKVLNLNNYNNKYEKEFIKNKKGLNLEERNLLIAAEISSGLLSEVSCNQDIIILDEGIFNRLISMQRLLNRQLITKEEFIKYADFYSSQIKSLINYTVVSYSKVLDNDDFDYEAALRCCKYLLDGNNLLIESDRPGANYRVLENLLPIMRSDYIKQLKLMLEKKRHE